MRSIALGAFLISAPFVPSIRAQEARHAADPAPGTPLGPVAEPPASNIVYPGMPLPPLETRNALVPSGSGLPALLDDGVPAPTERRVQTTESGDVVVEEGAGDPFFLSFASGSHFPPAGESIDPALVTAASSALASGRSETFAFVMFSKRMTPARLAVLEGLGARVQSFHPHYCLSVKLPVLSIDACASLDFVRWIGVATPQQKVHPRLVQELGQTAPGRTVDVWINVFESDLSAAASRESVGVARLWNSGSELEAPANGAFRVASGGWREAALRAQGVSLVEYVDSIRAFRARVLPSQIENLVGLDFVQFLEADLPAQLAHDESTPMVSNDITRAYFNGGTSQWVTVGHVDSGADLTHPDLANIAGVGWDFSGSATPFADGCEHGSHVMGTILGNGAVIGSQKGNAPGLGRFGGAGRVFMVRKYNDACASNGTSLSTIAGVLNADFNDGFAVSPKPIAINNSWGTLGSNWIGSEANARELDYQVYWTGQAWIFAAGNEGYGPNIRQEGTAKNVITVGSVDDYMVNGYLPGNPSAFSSTGPCGDGRWKPNVCAPGGAIKSVDANSGNAYKEMYGTSMAAPHVTGLVAQLCDMAPWLRYRSCALQTVLMASATTFNNQVLTQPPTASWEHLNTWGAGRIDGMRAMLGTGDSWWNTWTFDQNDNTWNWGDFSVPAGTTRIVVAMHYDEESASPGAGQALVNDWDLYLDQAPIDPNGNSGEWVAQQSSRDNTEIRILDNPNAGAWRWKVWPRATPVNQTVRMSVTVYFVGGPTQPVMSVQTNIADPFIKPNEHTTISTTVTNTTSFSASAAYLDVLDTFATVHSALVNLFDGSVANVSGNHQGGRDIELGNIPKNYARAVTWDVSWSGEGNWPWNPAVYGDNFNAAGNTQAYVTVDGTPPSNPSPISTSHGFWTWSANPTGTFLWNTPTDNLSGVDGYAVAVSAGAPVDPGLVQNLGAVNSWQVTLPGTGSTPSYMSIRAVDKCGNWSSYAPIGPFFVDNTPPSTPVNVGSFYAPGNWIGSNNFDITWSPCGDLHSGVAGYGVVVDQNPNTVPGVMTNPASSTLYSAGIPASGAYYAHVRAVDAVGNWSATTHAGPYLFNIAPVSTYCVAKVNSLGCTPSISSTFHGSVYWTTGFPVRATNVRNNKPGLLLYSTTGQASTPFQGGTLCLAAAIRRSTPLSSGGSPTGNDCTGVYQIDMNDFSHGVLGGTPAPELLVQGTLVRCQFWGRDPGFAAPNNSSLSNALEYFVCYY